MTANIYVLTDGVYSKIGITVNVERRMSAYNTHNPNFWVERVFECADEALARKVETTLKGWFKDRLVGSGREWFKVEAAAVSRLIAALLEPELGDLVTPSMHGYASLPSEAAVVRDTIGELIEQMDEVRTRDCPTALSKKSNELQLAKYRMAELFAASFQLGMPRHRLPENIVRRDILGIDLSAADLSTARNWLTRPFEGLPHDDHVWSFYHLAKLGSGAYFAMCTARVSMPYFSRISGVESDVTDAARKRGLLALSHHEWSWHYPEATALYLFQRSTPVSARLRMWETSFRKWIIERSRALEQEWTESEEKKNALLNAIDDICRDSAFPLDVQSAHALFATYLTPYYGMEWDEEGLGDSDSRWAYEVLFEKWNAAMSATK